MQIKKRTWSQQQLAVQLRNAGTAKQGLLSWDHQRLLIHSAQTALSATVCWWLARLFGLHDGFWGSISAIIVLQSNFGSTITASRDRLVGTFLGALFGFAFSFFGVVPWNYIVAVFAAMIVCGLIGFRSSSRLAGVTITIIMLVQSSSSHKSVALDRVIEVVFGIVVAVIVSTLVFPDRARLALRDGLAQEFLQLGALFEAILQGLHGESAEDLPALRKAVQDSLQANNQLLSAARNEPSGGPGWREGLSMVTQFGHTIFDALTALELAVKGGTEDDYVQQLEPALSQLILDIRNGFHHVAGCIHNWRFHVEPKGLYLEEDIARLEERMSAIRPHGIEFSQSEILRAYAVQLHLKQIARLLRASRVETSRAVGEAQKS